MPLSFGIPLGLVVAFVGVILFFATRYKKSSLAVIVIGVGVSLLTFLLVVLAVNSQM